MEEGEEGREGTNLAAPAHSKTTPFLDARVLFTNRLDHFQDLFGVFRGRSWPAEEFCNGFLLLLRVRRIVAVRKRLPVEKVGHEDLVLVGRVGVSEDVCALDGLRAVAEDVVDDEDGGGGGGGAGGVCVFGVKGSTSSAWKEEGDRAYMSSCHCNRHICPFLCSLWQRLGGHCSRPESC